MILGRREAAQCVRPRVQAGWGADTARYGSPALPT
jgi:hypothetical protein